MHIQMIIKSNFQAKADGCFLLWLLSGIKTHSLGAETQSRLLSGDEIVRN